MPALTPGFELHKIECTRASPSGKALAFQANIRRFESGRPLFCFNMSRSEHPQGVRCPVARFFYLNVSVLESASRFEHPQGCKVRSPNDSSLRAILPFSPKGKTAAFRAKRRGNLPFSPLSGDIDLQVSVAMFVDDGRPGSQGRCMVRRLCKNKLVILMNEFKPYETIMGLSQGGNVEYTVSGSDCPERGVGECCYRPTPSFSGSCSKIADLLRGQNPYARE